MAFMVTTREKRHRWRLSLVAVTGSLALLSAPAAQAAMPQPPAPPTITVKPTTGSRSLIPRSFLGFSIEYWTVPTLIGKTSTPAAPFVALTNGLAVNGPLVLRFGGDSEDRSWWLPNPKIVPAALLGARRKAADIANALPAARDSEYFITPDWIDATAGALRTLGSHAIVGLNLAGRHAAHSAAFAKAVADKYPAGSIDAFEPGNEPELYTRFPSAWLQQGEQLVASPIARSYSFAAYLSDWARYRDAVRSAVGPTTPLTGTALGCPWMSWCALTGDFFNRFKTDLKLATVHAYALRQPFDAAERKNPKNPLRATIQRLMSPEATDEVVAVVGRQAALAKRFGLKTRLAEMNTVPYGGAPGVSDRFAAALWAPSMLFGLQAAGIAGVNVHFGYGTAYRPFWITRPGGIPQAQVAPLYYGLRFFAEAAGNGGQVVPVKTDNPRGSVGTWLVEDATKQLRFAVVNRGSKDATVALTAAGRGTGELLRLRAPSINSASGVTWAGQSFGADGELQGTRRSLAVTPLVDTYSVTVPHHSAALLILPAKR